MCVQRPHAVQPPCDLIDVDTNLLQFGGLRPDVGGVDVDNITVYQHLPGVWEQRLRIHYNCVGTIEIPSALPLPTPDVSVNTRKGVVVNYAPCDVAI